jgi:putative RecB family exonuclease
LYRYRAIDRLPEAASAAAMRGTVVHSVLEALFQLDREQRTLEAAQTLVPNAYQKLRERDNRVDQLFTGSLTEEDFLSGARNLVQAYFQLEDPTRLLPESTELLVEASLEDGLKLKGYIDRLDVAPGSGALRVVDYKTGKSPAPRYQAEMLFQLRFYALVLWLTRGQIPAMVLLLYLGNQNRVEAVPSAGDLERTRLKIETIWQQINRMLEAQDFPPAKGPLCGWCSFQPQCPLFGGAIPPFPDAPAATTPQ